MKKQMLMMFALVVASAGNSSFAAELSSLNSSNYYDQFKYGVQGECSSKNSVMFRSNFNNDHVVFEEFSNRHTLEASFSLYLFENGTYTLRYSEDDLSEEIKPGFRWITNLFKKTINGYWGVNHDEISLSGFGTGKPLVIPAGDKYDKPTNGIEFQVSSIIHHPKLLNQKVIFIPGYTNVNYDGTYPIDYCRVNK